MRAVLRRSEGRRQRGIVRYAGLTLDPVTRAVAIEGRPVAVSSMEFALLQRLADQPDRVYTKHELLRDVWGYLAEGRTRTVDTHACRLRRKLDAASTRRWVINVRGVGYRLTEGD
ncbi:MAG: response regulator transcription factor [Solirubrobacterales bacterium]|nr:response regulator transcription factor [Solirubrobacterales bacterium]